jgi:DNA replication protein DnaC
VVDDDEMGRPARHDRSARQSNMTKPDFALSGVAERERVRGQRKCGVCGEKVVKVDVSGPADSIAVVIAKARLTTPLCDGCEVAEREREEAVERDAVLAQAILDRVRRSRVPAPWQTLTLDRLDEKPGQEEARGAAQRWVRGGGGLVLHGDIGRGKTMIAAAAAIERCAFSPVRWLPVAELLMKLRMPFGSDEYLRATLSLQASPSVALVLDDLDKLKPTEHSIQPLYVAIDGWIAAGAPLVVTLNRDLSTLASWMGDTFGGAIASRLAGYCDVVEVTGDDWRLA